MIRFNIVVLAVAASVLSVACGGSQPPAKDPSAAATPETAKKPPPTDPAFGLGGTGTGSAQGSGNVGH